MRISLFLNSTMSKRCVQPHKRNWFQLEQSSYTQSSPGVKQEFALNDSASRGKQTGSFQSLTTHVNHNRNFPDLWDICYEIKWLFYTLTTLSQALESAVTQFGALVLLAVTLLLLSAQVTGLVFILSSATTLPLGFQFMLASVVFISATAFKLMY